MKQQKIYDEDDIVLTLEIMKDIAHEVYQTTNYIITMKNKKNKIVSFAIGDKIYYDRDSFYLILQRNNVDINNTSAIDNAIKFLKYHCFLSLHYTRFIQFFNLQKTFNFRYSGEFFVINGKNLGYSEDELALSKRNHPQLRNIRYNFI